MMHGVAFGTTAAWPTTICTSESDTALLYLSNQLKRANLGRDANLHLWAWGGRRTGGRGSRGGMCGGALPPAALSSGECRC